MGQETRIQKAQDRALERLDYIMKTYPTADFVEKTILEEQLFNFSNIICFSWNMLLNAMHRL